MAFRKLKDVDKSDMELWASTPMAENFVAELEELKDAADRAVHKTLGEAENGTYKAYKKVLDMFEECRNGR